MICYEFAWVDYAKKTPSNDLYFCSFFMFFPVLVKNENRV